MNYKDKAKQLVEKYASIVPKGGYYTDAEYIVEDDNIDTAKQCAIIAGDSIIEAIENFDYSDTLVNYYENVKQAINEL